MANKIILQTNDDRTMEMVDHTQWFKKHGSVKGYHNRVIDNACVHRNAGSMKNIKKLARYDEQGNCLEILVAEGMRLES